MAGTAVAVAIAGGAVLGLAGPASAHNYLVASDPEVGGTLTALPKTFDITTNDKLLDIGGSGSGFAFRIVGPDGKYYEDGCVDIEGPSMTTTAALGDSGGYTVEWQIVSADGHTVSDEYPFTWKAPSGFTAATGASKPPTCATADDDGGDSDTTTGTAAGSSDSAASDALWIGAGGVVLVAAVVAVLLLLRRRPTPESDDTDD
ncbi:copper resistance CopC family protein [Curtobacterium sp. VKM Ac-1376]|uniref:copper resistance CopC family protein n=1 Tax=Curtobacterium sp. VKM Ac-1376 TaxID=123312 RepID=UPI00188D8808|nr:copper resistance CopC family protein [Curtobacterium sp. VKM Ac-1376]MBF4614772.1 copper resistance protein CopC [Curtobacterium sp. VKM Ac-1376]